MNQHPITSPRFGRGLGDAFSKAIQLLEKDRRIELTVTDVGGMVLPRTAIEYKERGPDMARETGIRELTATFTNIFIAGWMGVLAASLLYGEMGRKIATKLFGTHTLGINMGAWVNDKSMVAFSKLFEETLDEAAKGISKSRDKLDPRKPITLVHVREDFLRKIFSRMRDVSALGETYEAVAKQLKNTDVQQGFRALIKDNAYDYLESGKLSDDVIEKMIKLYDASNVESEGVFNLKKHVYEYMKKSQYAIRLRLQEHPAFATIGEEEFKNLINSLVAEATDGKPFSAKVTEGQRDAFRKVYDRMAEKVRVDRSISVVKSQETALKKAVNLLEYQMSEKAHLMGTDGKPLLKKRGSETILRDVKYMMEQYFDPVLRDARGNLRKTQVTDNLKKEVLDALFKKNKSTLWSRAFPSVKDGLVSFTRKMKRLTTIVPVGASIAIAVSVAFFNNWLTQRKHDGKVFFPGETLSPDDPGYKEQALAQDRSLYSQPLNRNSNLFNQFYRSQQRTAGSLSFGGGLPMYLPTQTGGFHSSSLERPEAVKFGGFAPGSSGLLGALDFDELGATTVSQSQVLYAAVIVSRIVAAINRGMKIDSFNEAREHFVRDVFGWTLWFFGAPAFRQGIASYASPEKYRQAFASMNHKAAQEAKTKGLWHRVLFNIKTFATGDIPSEKQLNILKHQTLSALNRSYKKGTKEVVKKASEQELIKYFEGLARYRNWVSGLSIGAAILTLGVGLPIVNILMTRHNVRSKHKEQGAR